MWLASFFTACISRGWVQIWAHRAIPTHLRMSNLAMIAMSSGVVGASPLLQSVFVSGVAAGVVLSGS